MENNELPTSLRGKWIHMKVFLTAETAGDRREMHGGVVDCS